ncbi:MAG: two-component hybrid sensor and regulator [Candidatus Magnetoglobus multicellularis str. Araruama]|uniref:histidine kinase n=1 Tax=Candidatus Magnetoglobus multicellularis str. Araruama TaxID=890399 RepID=A0A1V1PGU1_9BACT|nr:MAG: two-component hybrid sensor and regulator [Candidatus Magnetoglobus multicellularis str. Araruama]
MNQRTLNVLLIEDNRMDAELFMDVFTNEEDIHIKWVTKLSEATEKIQKNHYDMLLLDLNLPDSTGLDTFNTLKTKAKDIPIVILTGDDNEQNALDAVRMGAQDYLVKKTYDANFLLPRTIRLSIERDHIRKQLNWANKALKEKNDSLNQFVYMVNHDLKVPLNSIIGFSQLLINEIDDNIFKNVKEFSQLIHHSGTKMAFLIEELFAFINAENQAMNMKKVSINDCVDEVTHMLTIEIEKANGQIFRDALPNVIGDNHLLTQVFQNLIGNALKYLDNKSPQIHITYEMLDNKHIIGVKDNGIGIRPEHFNEIFEPFKRLHTQDKYTGTGIGLAICKKIVDRHMGKIWVESESGNGSHFKFYLGTKDQNKARP